METAVKKAIALEKAGPVLLRQMLLTLLKNHPSSAPPMPVAAATAPVS